VVAGPPPPDPESVESPVVPILQHLALSSGTVDFASVHRDDNAWLEAAWCDDRARVLVLRDGAAVMAPDGDGIGWIRSPEAPADAELRIFLGLVDDDVPHFAVALDADGAVPDALADSETRTLRDLGLSLAETEAGLFVHALALVRWHANHRFCSRCGAASVSASGGHTRRCPVCGAQHFPRTDPAIIVLVTDADDRALLVHGAAWPPGQFSTVAGFVEPGETLEAAVIREVAEESAIVVTEPVYAGSQPWPFPASLMLGYLARATSTAIVTDDVEVTGGRWFSRAELSEALAAGEVTISSALSISHHLIRHWYGAELPPGRPRPSS